MPHTLILHIANTDPVVGEVDELPTPSDIMIAVTNPRRKDGKDLHYLAENASIVYWPIATINFIEVITEEIDEEIISFVRE